MCTSALCRACSDRSTAVRSALRLLTGPHASAQSLCRWPVAISRHLTKSSSAVHSTALKPLPDWSSSCSTTYVHVQGLQEDKLWTDLGRHA